MSVQLLAHGVSGRADLPLSLAIVSYSAGAIVLLSFAALAWLWPSSRWERVHQGKLFPPPLSMLLRAIAWPLRIAGVVLLGVATWAAFTGPIGPTSNIVQSFVYIIWWVGFLFASGFIGDLWRAIGPIPAIARAFPERTRTYTLGHWPAATVLLAFTWLELVHPDAASARVVGWAVVIYLGLTFAGLVVWGRAWARDGDPFGALFGLVGLMAPFYADDRGRLRVRPPLVGLTSMRAHSGTVALVVVALGSTTYDGLARTRLWTNQFGDGNILINTAGLLWTIGAVYALYRLAVSAMPALAGVPAEDRDPGETASAFVHSLVPIALAYAVAHYFSLLAFEGQTFVAALSDPAGKGWNLFGTGGWDVSYTAPSPNVIAYVQTGAIVLGHVAGVILAHDRAVWRYPSKVATRTQYPLLAVMIAYTVGALLILLSG